MEIVIEFAFCIKSLCSYLHSLGDHKGAKEGYLKIIRKIYEQNQIEYEISI